MSLTLYQLQRITRCRDCGEWAWADTLCKACRELGKG